MAITEITWNSSPFASMFKNIKYCIQHHEIVNIDISSMTRKSVGYFFVVLLCYFHSLTITESINQVSSANRPQVNYTLTNFAEHSEKFSHDALNRYLAGERLTPNLVWEHVKDLAEQTARGFLVFDDTAADKRYSSKIELARPQYSGNAHGVIQCIGIVTCVYVNPETDQFWIIDYRIFDPDNDGKTKLDHVKDMLLNCVHQKQLRFSAVLMDSWYAAKEKSC